MPAKVDGRVTIDRVRGRNGYDPPSELPEGMVAEALNVVPEQAGMIAKRRGAALQSGFSVGGSYSGFNVMFKYVPSQSETNIFFVWVDRSATTKILSNQTGTVRNLTLADSVDSEPQNVRAAIINKKLYLAYDSAENRLHVYDATRSNSTTRRVGFALPAAATVADTGAGTYAATLRYYRIQWTDIATTTRRLSNLGASVSFTPSGGGTHARVTRPTAPSESETGWRVYGSADGTTYFLLSAEIAIATTTYDDNVNPSDYDNGEAAPVEGTYTPWPSVKFLLSDGERLLGLGAWESTTGSAMPPKDGRVWFSPVLDTTDTDDDERVSNTTTFKGWIDIGRNVGSRDRGLAGPINGEIMVGQSDTITLLIPTGDAEAPYQRRRLTDTVGWVSQESTFVGEDGDGRPCVYFLDEKTGPHRYGANGLEWLGYDVQDLWATVNLLATTRVAHGLWHGEKKCAIFWLAGTNQADPTFAIVHFARLGVRTESQGVRYGWFKWDGDFTEARCALVYFTTFNTSARGESLYVGDAANTLLRMKLTTATDDGGAAFQSYITSRSFEPPPEEQNTTLTQSYLRAKAGTNVEIQQTITRNYGDVPNVTDSVVLTADGVQSRVMRKFPHGDVTDAHGFQVTLGDASAVSNAWALDQWIGLYRKEEQR